MKHIIILGDGMADHAVDRLGGKTLLEYANTPNMDHLARIGRTGRLNTVPDGFLPGSEVANATILGYDMNKVYEGRGPLEAASIGYDMRSDDFALRCNIICIADGKIKNHHGGHLSTDDCQQLIDLLNEKLGNDRVMFIKGIQYRHLLIIRGGNKHVTCAPPHDHPNEPWRKLLVTPEPGYEDNGCKFNEDAPSGRMTAQQTADLLNDLILKSQQVLANAPLNIARRAEGKDEADCIWPWGGGYRPQMKTLQEMYPQIKRGDVISAVDLIRGIGRYAGLHNIIVPGATSKEIIAGVIADEAAIGMVNSKTTAVRIIPAVNKKAGELVDFGGLLGYGHVMKINTTANNTFIERGGRIPSPMQALKN